MGVSKGRYTSLQTSGIFMIYGSCIITNSAGRRRNEGVWRRIVSIPCPDVLGTFAGGRFPHHPVMLVERAGELGKAKVDEGAETSVLGLVFRGFLLGAAAHAVGHCSSRSGKGGGSRQFPVLLSRKGAIAAGLPSFDQRPFRSAVFGRVWTALRRSSTSRCV